MTEESLAGGSDASICPWCSASYTGEPEHCPSCGAVLAVDPAADPSLPGLTAIDPAALVRSKTPPARGRNRILSWISGEYPDEAGDPADAGALAPPDIAVRREILRLQLEAEVANLQAEADALIADATVEGHAPGVSPEETAAADALVEEMKSVSHSVAVAHDEAEASAPADAETTPAPMPSESATAGTSDEAPPPA